MELTPVIFYTQNSHGKAGAQGKLTHPTWHFPDRGGGIDFVNDPSRTHFRDAPIPKLVRELIQNSLDAKQEGISDPVTVTFTETAVERSLLSAPTLERHLQSCLDRASRDDRTDLSQAYRTALSVVENQEIPCLKVQDSGTTGLNEHSWNALVLQEGGVSKGTGAPGGSFGIGKNAVLNVSDVQTVFYSTRLVEGKKGRVEKLQGKATLTGHPDPDEPRKNLQHIGFYCTSDSRPLMGNDIPEFFRLDDTGTGVFIMGFNPHSSKWVNEVATSVIENFFYAIHHKRLVVTVVPIQGDSVQIDHQTIDQLFDDLPPINQGAVHYYRAIRGLDPDEIVLTKRFRNVGQLRVYVVFDESAPRRIAHINRNGMLITDSREQRVNPLAPRRRGLWPDFVGVVVPETDAGDLWLRRMENPSHDSLSSGQLLSESERRTAESRFRQVRREIRDIIEQKAEIDRYETASNIDELAGILPDDGDRHGTRALSTRVIESQAPNFRMNEITDRLENLGNDPGEDPGVGQGKADGDSNATGIGEGNIKRPRRSEQRSSLRRVRYIPLSPNEAVIAFDPASDPTREVRIALAPAGADPEPRRSAPVAIIEATRIGPEEVPLSVEGGQVTFIPESDDRVTIRILADGELDHQAFRLR